MVHHLQQQCDVFGHCQVENNTFGPIVWWRILARSKPTAGMSLLMKVCTMPAVPQHISIICGVHLFFSTLVSTGAGGGTGNDCEPLLLPLPAGFTSCSAVFPGIGGAGGNEGNGHFPQLLPPPGHLVLDLFQSNRFCVHSNSCPLSEFREASMQLKGVQRS